MTFSPRPSLTGLRPDSRGNIYPHVVPFDCCGLGELAGVMSVDLASEASRRAYLQKLMNSLQSFGGKFLVFSVVAEKDNDGEFELFGHHAPYLLSLIARHKLGTVVEAGEGVNPNSGNLLKVYVWTLDKEAIAEWILEGKE